MRWLTAGESHGKGLAVIIEGFPSGVTVERTMINGELSRRQKGYGRGKRMGIEHDSVEIHSGIRYGVTIGSPICFVIPNSDHENWLAVMDERPAKKQPPVSAPRPGHADLAGFQKYGCGDIRNVIERASARETAARVAVGALCKCLLKVFGVRIISHVIAVGGIAIAKRERSFAELEGTMLRCLDPTCEREMVACIDRARDEGDTLGGVCEVIAQGLFPGLGTYAQHDRRLDARVASAMLSIPSVKGMAIGHAAESAGEFGSSVHDEIHYERERGFYRDTNRAGGIEGGVSNGEDIIIRLTVKPVPTLAKPLGTVDVVTRAACYAQRERADVCVVPAVGVIGESMLAWVLADALLEKFGSDNLDDIVDAYGCYRERILR